MHDGNVDANVGVYLGNVLAGGINMDYEYLNTGLAGKLPVGLPGGFFVYEAEGDEKITFAEPNVFKLYECETYEEFIDFTGGTFKGMVHPDDLYKIQDQIQAQTMFGEKRHDYVRYRIMTKSGKVRYIEDFGHLLHWNSDKSFFYVFIVDVDQNEFYNNSRNSIAEARILSTNHDTDPLTGLFTMSLFYQRVQRLLNDPKGRRNDISFIHFDIPNFKLYNERHGFKLGDELLCEFAKNIREIFDNATVSRFSDDHFVVCDLGDRGDAVIKVEEVNRRMMMTEDANRRVRIKAGIYFLDDRGAEVGLACDHARLACNSIKHRHDVYYCIYDEMLREQLRKQQYVVDHIDEAIDNEYIKVFYQPVIRVRSGEICGYEALVRWNDPKVGMLNPGDFIETLEEFHLIHLVDSFVIKKVCQDYKRLMDAGEDVVPVSVNISRLDFELCDIFGILEETRKQYDVPVEMIDIEITESALNDNVGHIKLECDEVRKLGYKIWLDDFGSGYSSLNTLAEYSFDVLKLDLVFFRSYDRNPKTGQLMEYIIQGSRGLGLAPLCEGVESEEHYEFLKRVGCERAQGYYFGKPMPMDETRAFTGHKGMTWEKR